MRLEDALVGPFCYLRGRFRVVDRAEEGVPGTFLRDRAFLDDALARFAAGFPEADPRAVASYWSLWYFNGLIVPTVAVTLRLERTLPVSLDRVRLLVDEASGTVPAIRLPDPGMDGIGEMPFEPFRGLIRHHLAPLVAAVSHQWRLAPRLLWANAAHYLEWTLAELARDEEEPSEAVDMSRRLVSAERWPDGWTNPMAGAIRYVDEGGGCVRRRRVCCLRHRIPSVEGCGALCPLKKVRAGIAVGGGS